MLTKIAIALILQAFTVLAHAAGLALTMQRLRLVAELSEEHSTGRMDGSCVTSFEANETIAHHCAEAQVC